MRKRNSDSLGDYKIGYGKPPVKGRFAKGKSGNPRGRPRGRTGFMTQIAKMLDKRVTAREGERVRTMTWLEALVSTTMQRALKGDVASARVLLTIVRSLDVHQADTPNNPASEDLSADDRRIIERFLERGHARISKGDRK